MTKSELATRIQARLQDIPASYGGYISVAPSTLRSVLSRELLERIADDAADEALAAMSSQNARREMSKIRPLTEGYIDKGGRNHGPSQITERPPAPAPITYARARQQSAGKDWTDEHNPDRH